MPFKIVEEQQRFTFRVNGDGLPVAQVVRWGAGVWVKCCPLCGCLHEILKGQIEGEFEPRCILKVTHKAAYAAWVKKHPESPKYTRVLLEYKPFAIVPFSPPVIEDKSAVRPKRGRKKAA